jgi:hypothetical protein
MRAFILAALFAVSVAVLVLANDLERREREQYEAACAERGATAQWVGPDLLLCLTDDGRVVPIS